MSEGLAGRLSIGASLAVAGVCLTVVELRSESVEGAPGLANRLRSSPPPTGGDVDGWWVRVDLAPETLERTLLGSLEAGHEVNLEPAMRLADAVGGHLVQGHVDGLVRVVRVDDRSDERIDDSASLPAAVPVQAEPEPAPLDRTAGPPQPAITHRELTCELPVRFGGWVVEKGSVTLDGVSLTVAALGEEWFRVALIPHTLAVTTLGAVTSGQALHFEADVLAKYVERAVAVQWAQLARARREPDPSG